MWLSAVIAAFIVFGMQFALYLVPWDAESGYLVFGYRALRGEIRLFQDEIVGQRLPLPFYIIGLTQIIVGPSLLAGRLLSVGLGTVASLLTFRLGWLIGGRPVAFIGLLLLVTHGIVVGYYAAASHFALTALLIIAGVWAVAEFPGVRGHLVCMACFSTLALSRPNLVPLVPAVAVYLLILARGMLERVVIISIAVGPLAAFLLTDVEHLKILSYVPGVAAIVEPLGYRSLFDLGAQAMIPADAWPVGLAWFLRRHMFWIATTALATVSVAWAVRHRRTMTVMPPLALFCAGLALYGLAAQAVVYRMYPKSISAYVVALAPLWAITLACGLSLLLCDNTAARRIRMVTCVIFAAILLLSPTFSRHSAMPRPLPTATTIELLARTAVRISSVVPRGARVFLVGASVVPYLAGVEPYPQQVMHEWTLVPSADAYAISRSGLWGTKEIDAWLGHDAPFALIDHELFDELRNIPDYRPLVSHMDRLLQRHFVLVTVVSDFPWKPHLYVYRRISSETTPR